MYVAVRARYVSTAARRWARLPVRWLQTPTWLQWTVCPLTGWLMTRWHAYIVVHWSSRAPSCHQSPSRYLLDPPNCRSTLSARRSAASTVSASISPVHTHTRLTALFRDYPGEPVPEGKTNIWILLRQETVSGSGISWAVCKYAPRSKQITMSSHHWSFLQVRCPSCHRKKQCQSNEGLSMCQVLYYYSKDACYFALLFSLYCE